MGTEKWPHQPNQPCIGFLPQQEVPDPLQRNPKEMQKWASAGMDGYIGPQTILAWQKKLGTPIDGTVSSPSAMVKKLQKWCNQK